MPAMPLPVSTFHKMLSHQETTKTGRTELLDGQRVGQSALTDFYSLFWQIFCQSEGRFDIGHKRAQMTVVDAAEVGHLIGIVELFPGMHLQ